VFGRYVLETELGAGGMGVVWRAHDTELDESVALKFLPEAVARDGAAVNELKAETRHARRLTHPNIVRIYHFEREGGMAAISMELVDGVTLAKLRLEQPGTVFSAEAVAPLMGQLCRALDYAHNQAKIVHRDLKPSNILVARDGVVKVTDFGISRSLSDTHTRLTGRAGDTSGTLVYMSPQQLMGADPAASDDIYAFGSTLYELFTGKPPFYTGDVGLQIREVAPKSVNQRRTALGLIPVAVEWENAILACLSKKREDRPQSAGEVLARLELAGNTAREKSQAASPGYRLAHLLPREFTVIVYPADAGSRVWLGPVSNIEVNDGRAVVRDLPDGEQELIVQAEGYQPFTTRVTVKDGRGRAEARLIAVKGVAIEARPGTIVTAVDARRGQIGLGGTMSAGGVLTGNDRTVEVSVTMEKIRGAEEGQAWTVPDLSLEMTHIRAGSFTMGSPSSEEGRFDSESPQTMVKLTKGYWLGKTQITQAQWEALMGNNPSNFKGVDRPVEQVSWEDAVQFCRKLTERERQAGRLPEGYEYTLPTAAQWEYACRAGTTGPFAGSGKLDEVGWYNRNSGGQPHSVGKKRPNAWGCYDMHGNVWEWCHDWYGKYPGGSVTDPTGPPSGSDRVLHGGSWADSAQFCRSAFRSWIEPDSRFNRGGFRVALTSATSLSRKLCRHTTIKVPRIQDMYK